MKDTYKRDIPRRIYGGLSFYQRKEIMMLWFIYGFQPQRRREFKTNYQLSSKGNWTTTVDKLVVGAKQHNLSIFGEERAQELQIGVNAGTAQKLTDFVTSSSLQVFNENANAFETADEVTKRTRIVLTKERFYRQRGSVKLRT